MKGAGWVGSHMVESQNHIEGPAAAGVRACELTPAQKLQVLGKKLHTLMFYVASSHLLRLVMMDSIHLLSKPPPSAGKVSPRGPQAGPSSQIA